MKIAIQVKQVGNRKNLGKSIYDCDQSISTLRELISFLVVQEVAKYNAKTEDNQLLKYLSERDIAQASEEGKVGFGYVYANKKADEQEAIYNAMMCFKDGLVRVFKDNVELKDLDAEISINDGDEFTFIRMIFLAGRMW